MASKVDCIVWPPLEANPDISGIGVRADCRENSDLLPMGHMCFHFAQQQSPYLLYAAVLP